MRSLDSSPDYYSIDFSVLGAWLISLRFWIIFLIISGWMISAYGIFDSSYIQYLSDTFLYKELSQQPLTMDFLVHGARSPTLPILLKLFKSEDALVNFQLAFFFASWLTLFLVLGTLIKTHFVYAALVCVLAALSVSSNFFCWHKIILSESISLSGAVLLFAQLCRFMTLESVTKKTIEFLLSGWIIWQFTRDTNAYFSLFIAIGFMAICTVARLTEASSEKWKKGQIISAVILLFAFLQIASINSSDRWKFPLVNVIGLRILPDAEHTREFVELGMPMNDKVICFTNKVAVDCNADWSGFGEWFETGKAKVDYQRWLLMNLPSTIAEVFTHWETIWTPDTMLYSHATETPLSASATAIAQPRGIYFLIFISLSLLSVVMALCVVVRAGCKHWLAILLLFYAVNVPMAFIAYHGDALDIDRHMLNVQLSTCLTGWILIMWGLSYGIETIRKSLGRRTKVAL